MMKLLKLFWEIDKTYCVMITIFMLLTIWSVVKKDMTFYNFNIIFLYMSFNELRYKYDNRK